MRKFCYTQLSRPVLAAAPAIAALKVGDKAPDFTTVGAVGGKDFKIHLRRMLKKGPVVLYFFPKAFTSGCTAEAHAFSQSIGDFKKAGAQVIGMSGDDLRDSARILGEGMPQRLPGRDGDAGHRRRNMMSPGLRIRE